MWVIYFGQPKWVGNVEQCHKIEFVLRFIFLGFTPLCATVLLAFKRFLHLF